MPRAKTLKNPRIVKGRRERSVSLPQEMWPAIDKQARTEFTSAPRLIEKAMSLYLRGVAGARPPRAMAI